MKERIKHLVLLIILLAIDQVSKFWVRTYLINRNPVIIIPKVLNLQYYENTGAVWGILSGKIPFLILFTFFLLAVILYVYVKIPSGKKFNILKILAVFIVAGALGNLADRILLGHVVDFIYFEIINFPLFNFADSCLTVSSILLLILAIFYFKDDDFAFLSLKKKKNSSSALMSDSEEKTAVDQNAIDQNTVDKNAVEIKADNNTDIKPDSEADSDLEKATDK